MQTDTDRILEKLTDFHSEFTEFRGEFKVRVEHVEEEVANAKKWENIKIFMVLPVVAGLHAVATKIGLLKG